MDTRRVMTALELALQEQRRVCSEEDSCYEQGYLDGLERAANIVTIKHQSLRTGAEPSLRPET
jgi:hypothetical protein